MVSREADLRLYSKVKYGLDCLICLILLVVVIPICLIFSVLIMLESPGNPFFTQERVGLNGRTFKIYKLRSMYKDAEKGGHQWARKHDSRITRVGKFIRKTRIDELPQVINIIKNDMRLIGPRPERPEFVEEFLKEIPDFNDRLAVNPGITGWAQVNGGYELTPKEKLEYDKYYIRHENPKLDLLILCKTVGVIFTGDGAR